jgi:hypothetical protein
MELPRGREKWYERLTRVVNSTACFSLAYLVITYAFWLVMAIAGLIVKFDAFVFYYGIRYMLNDRDWTTLKVTFIFSIGSLFCLVLGVVCKFVFDRLKKFPSIVHVFLLWCFVIGTVIFTSQAVIAILGTGKYTSPFYQGFAVVYSWWHLPKAGVYLLAIPMLLLFAYFAVNYARPFITLAYSYSKVNTEKRRKIFFIEAAFIPFIIGSVLTTAATYPMNIKVHGVYMAMMGIAMVIGWISLVYVSVSKHDVLRYSGFQRLNPVALFLLSLAAYFVFASWKGINIHLR